MYPFVVVKKSDSEGESVSLDIFSKLIEDRIIFLYEEIDSLVASKLIATLLYLDSQNHTDEITVYINSPGGEIECFFAIYDTFQMIASPIKTICVGEACSAAAMLLAAGSPGSRYICPNAQVMIHHVQISDLEGSKTEVVKEVNRIEELNQTIVEILARHCGQTSSVVEKDCREDKYMGAKEAVKYGIVDSVLEPKKKKLPLKRKRRGYK